MNKANKHLLESFARRTGRVRSFLNLFKPSVEYDIVPLRDVYGPTAVDLNIQGLVVSKETLSGAAAGWLISPPLRFIDSDFRSTRSRSKAQGTRFSGPGDFRDRSHLCEGRRVG